MLTYLVVFVVAVFLIRIPIFLFGLLFRFGKPISLIGFGAFLGVSLATGVPDPSLMQDETLQPSNTPSAPAQPIELIEAASKVAQEVESEFRILLAEIDWKELLA